MEKDERGSALPLLVLGAVLAGALALQVGRMGGAAGARAMAQTAADAAALAGAADGEPAARALAEANGGRLAAFEERGRDTRVVVELGPARATARARRQAGDLGGGARGRAGGATHADPGGLAPAMRAALARAEQLLGQPVPVTSGYRSPEKQRALWLNRASNPFPVAAPGTSMHERGLAVDVPASFVPRLAAVAARAGLCQPYPKADPIHFEVCR
ncbi:MAG TPA: M15 family metallopeptidase [Acidimicrobiales bacterium]|nr:M15 family metallopeptidase [Acidimicrobiales bacterium]